MPKHFAEFFQCHNLINFIVKLCFGVSICYTLLSVPYSSSLQARIAIIAATVQAARTTKYENAKKILIDKIAVIMLKFYCR